ncbi:ABC transporter substrate-binding protein/permease [Gordonia hydrophobica]|uniref:ABC transporter substrate-binding protein/permease n=1 Tax=Gordonia hydrophobica TaxID=40516 RepID=A0ABZ2TZP1_9ACTN|nr:ABC transporter substrate-binding protein/permease [Gordonia hydrophobica]MBM7366329.1 polar amino acid transport system substrate-binding protein [Gordonia hydrophobica]
MTLLSAARRRWLPLLVVAVLVALLASCSASSSSDDDTGLCAPPGVDSASTAPTNLASAATQAPDRFTTQDVTPLDQIDVSALNLIKPNTIVVGTLSDAPPSICVNSKQQFTGMDNEMLRAIADKLGLKVEFVGTEFSSLLAQVASHRFDVGSSSITTTDERRQTVDFTNGYDFGYFALAGPANGKVRSFDDLNAGTRIGVVQGTVQDDYVVNTLHLTPVKFPDYATAYANLKSGQIDAWVAPSQQAEGTVQASDGIEILENTFSINNFTAWAVAKNNRALADALNSGLDAIIADGTWARLYSDWAPRPLPDGWKPGSKSAPAPDLPDFEAIAQRNADKPHENAADAAPKSTLTQLRETFFSGEQFRKALPELFKTGLPNTLKIAVTSGIIGTVLGMLLAVAGISRSRWLRWPARVYTDIFRGLPAVVVILMVGLGFGPIVKDITGGNPFWLGSIALGLLAAAYIGEIFRSGIQSVESGQMEAARALGFSYRSSMSLVVVPQGVRRVLPALMNQFIVLIKDSSLIYFLGLTLLQRDLFAVGKDFNANGGNLTPLLAAGLLYLLMTVPLTHLVNYIDNRLRTGKA